MLSGAVCVMLCVILHGGLVQLEQIDTSSYSSRMMNILEQK